MHPGLERVCDGLNHHVLIDIHIAEVFVDIQQ